MHKKKNTKNSPEKANLNIKYFLYLDLFCLEAAQGCGWKWE